MQRKDLALRVLSTAAIMSIVTSIAAPAFAGTYYMDNGNLSIRQDEYGKVWVKSGNSKELEDKDDEVIICGGAGDNKWSNAPSGGAALTSGTPAAEEQQPDPNAGSTLNETQEGSAQTKEGSAQTEEGSAQTEEGSAQTQQGKDTTKKEEDSPKDPSTEPAPTTSADPEEKTLKTTQADAPAADPAPATPAAGSVTPSTTNVIKVVNNWVDKAAKELKIRLSNVNIKSNTDAAMTVSGDGNTKIELDGKNTLDSSNTQDTSISGKAGLNKQGNGTMTITDEKTDDGEIRTSKAAGDETGSLTVVGGKNAAGIGGNTFDSKDTKNITIEGYATIDAKSGQGRGNYVEGGAAIGGGDGGSADNIVIRGNANVKATTGENTYGAAIGSGAKGERAKISIQEHAKVDATSTGDGAAIGKGLQGKETDITIGTEGKTANEEDVCIVANGDYAIGGFGNEYGFNNYYALTNIVIQGGARIKNAAGRIVGIGGQNGKTTITIKDEAHIENVTGGSATGGSGTSIGGIGARRVNYNENLDDSATITIQDKAKIDKAIAISGRDVKETIITIKDNAEIGELAQIYAKGASTTNNSAINILNNATIKKLTLGIYAEGYGKIAIDGGEDGKVRINENNPGAGRIKQFDASGRLQIGNNVLMKLLKTQYGDGPIVDVSDDTLKTMIGADTEIWYTTDAQNGLQKIIHGKNICKKGSTQNIIKQPTCTEPGSAKYTCHYEKTNGATKPSCDRTWTETIPINPDAHDWGEWKVTTPATCKEEGVRTRTCKNNSSHTETQKIAKTENHRFNDWHQTKAPTCLEEGEEQRECSVCGKTETHKLDKLAHVEELRGAKEPTCTEPGYTGDKWCTRGDHLLEKGSVIPKKAHDWGDWHLTKAPTCLKEGEEQHECKVCGKPETRKVDKLDHVEELRGAKEPTCTEPGYTGDKWCTRGDHLLEKGSVIPVTGHHWKDNGDGTHTCTNCGATEGQPFNTNSALELRVVDAEGMDQPFTVSQNGTLRTYTGAYDIATLTGDLDTLRYLQDHGAQTIRFVTNGQTSSFDINDLLAQGSGSEVFYLTHRGAEEPTLLLVEADHSDLVKD